MSLIVISDMENVNKEEEGPPSKKMKQARLPFKPLEQKPQVVSPQSSKKRKLSDAESPSAKLQKNHRQDRQPSGEKPSILEHDPEVSSSSEAENVPARTPNRIRNALERFVCRKSQEEISSTNECIDLSSCDGDENLLEKNKDVETEPCSTENDMDDDERAVQADSSVKEKSERGSAGEVSTTEPLKENKNAVEKGNTVDAQTSKGDIGETEITSKDQAGETEADICTSSDLKKSNVEEVAMEDDTREGQNDPIADIITPVKTKLSNSLVSTPVSGGTPGCATTPSASPGESTGTSDNMTTPKLNNKPARSKLSEAKRKECEAQRQRIKEERERVMEEKKRKKEQERIEKEKLREEKKKEKEEEKAEKERLKKEEKEKREKERLEKLQIKEEEKRKKQELLEAKQEEKRKKEEEIKQKKEEKQREEEEKQKKKEKVKAVFQSFFKKTSPVSKPAKEPEGMFMPFEIKKDMMLAPSCNRDNLDEEGITSLDKHLSEQTCKDLYVKELKSKEHLPKKTPKISSRKLVDDDVMIVHDSETVKKVTYHCKLLQFHMNYRPPYYGTWRKASKVLTPRNPWKQDADLFDYEVDSDDEWEEEEPGESLSASEGEDEKEDEKEEEDEDGWMVPHGYLSEDEGCEEDEEVTPEMMKARRTARAEAWESEMKRQTRPALPVIIGCVWQQGLHSIQQQLESTLQQYKAVCLTSSPIPTTHSGATTRKLDNSPSDRPSLTTPKGGQRKPVPEEAMPDLIRLVHGNLAGIKKLVREFRFFWKQKVSGETGGIPNQGDISMEVEETDSGKKSENMEKNVAMETDEVTNESEEFCISKRQLELKISSIAVREKRNAFKKVCWYVHDKLLEQYGLQDLPVPSEWEFISQPFKIPNPSKPDDVVTPPAGRKTPTVSITQFARPMSPSQIAAQHQAVAIKQAKEAAEAKKAMEAKQAALERQAALQKEASNQMSPALAIVVENGVVKKALVDQKSISLFTKQLASPRSAVSSHNQNNPKVKSVAKLSYPLQQQKSEMPKSPKPPTGDFKPIISAPPGTVGLTPSPQRALAPQKKRIVPITLSSLHPDRKVDTDKKSFKTMNSSMNAIQTTAVIEPVPFSVKQSGTIRKPPAGTSLPTVKQTVVDKRAEELKLNNSGDNSNDAIVID